MKYLIDAKQNRIIAEVRRNMPAALVKASQLGYNDVYATSAPCKDMLNTWNNRNRFKK